MRFLETTIKSSRPKRNSHDDNRRLPSRDEATVAKTWMTRGLTFNVEYAKALMLKMNCVSEIPSLFKAIINILLFLSHSSKKSLVRGKALKPICKIIRIKPENLMEKGIQQIIKLRVKDTNTFTRESALDMLHQFFLKANQTEN